MVNLYEPTEEDEEWIKLLPECARKIADRLPPWQLYRIKTSGHRVFIYSYSESGTVTVEVNGKYNLGTFDRHVFGINPDDLEPCELPTIL